tara:strand:+ start:519 stop:923 length:405 start_codon:yes stop_codon:yes gene_type:complete
VRGEDVFQESLFTTVQLESFVPADHPLWPIKALLGEAMKNLNWLFCSIYCDTGRESIPPEPRSIYDEDDRLEPDTNESATGVVCLDGGKSLRSPPVWVENSSKSSVYFEKYSFKRSVRSKLGKNQQPARILPDA